MYMSMESWASGIVDIGWETIVADETEHAQTDHPSLQVQMQAGQPPRDEAGKTLLKSPKTDCDHVAL
ncbi:hypothetical protein D3C72_2198760 [compost metagenome]